MSDNGEDKLAAAITAAEEPKMIEVAVGISSTGRTFQVRFPDDASEPELAEFAGWVLTTLLLHQRAKAATKSKPESRLVVARGSLPRH
jgi:hypothetical protein